MAIGERMMAARLNTAASKVIDHYTYVLAGDGCLMEGVSAEACSLRDISAWASLSFTTIPMGFP
jgi:transketolase